MIYSDCIRKINEILDLQAGPVVVVEQLRATYSSILGLPSSKCTGVWDCTTLALQGHLYAHNC
jgi:hypothetical protein